ncbi:copper amine oxidase N-terminal domain-containing protein [Lysinibacillus capsici]|uniref:copper amine oxidase N-terminal domain-containing protein n=1 Tax=Lysinibacillus capsici TaxID=2115968 RepID=UPI002E226308|nr:copper amine oxidase N-terminal domain-containing protein [Lysinibacillus capsici]
MKKLRFMIPLLFCLFLGLGINNVNASQGVAIYINGEKQSFSNQAVIENGSTLVPLRGIFESLGANVQWNQSTHTIDASKGNTKVWLKIGSKNAKVNDNAINLSVPAQVKSGKTLVPLRFISESLGANVQWNQKTQTVTITGDSNSGKIEEEIEIPTLKLGETYSDNQIEVTIKKVEYVQEKYYKGYKVYFSVKNKSKETLDSMGGLQFKINESKYQKEINNNSIIIHFGSSRYIYEGESKDGYYEYIIDRDVKIEEITYHMMDGGVLKESKAKWIVE